MLKSSRIGSLLSPTDASDETRILPHLRQVAKVDDIRHSDTAFREVKRLKTLEGTVRKGIVCKLLRNQEQGLK